MIRYQTSNMQGAIFEERRGCRDGWCLKLLPEVVGRPDRGAARNSLLSGRFLSRYLSFHQLQIFEALQLKEWVSRTPNSSYDPKRCSSMKHTFFPNSLDGGAYLVFLKQVLPKLLDAAHVHLLLRRSMWYQHDVTLLHHGIPTHQHLNIAFGQLWIDHGGPVH
ncbi:hypothetical protein TNCV_3549021 [Trichonephila clavipes]|nr:hypothetical protein TNCV_3549021 [Trichonephila clavipes]